MADANTFPHALVARDIADMLSYPVAQLDDGARIWVKSTQSNYYLSRTTPLPVDGTDVLAPDPGAAAGNHSARWLNESVVNPPAATGVHEPVLATSQTELPASTYEPTTQTIKSDVNMALPAQDTVALEVGDRFLYNGDPTGLLNGIYDVVSVGASIGDLATPAPFVLQRSADAASSASFTTGVLADTGAVGAETGDSYGNAAICFKTAPLARGSHTVELRWKTFVGAMQCAAASAPDIYSATLLVESVAV